MSEATGGCGNGDALEREGWRRRSVDTEPRLGELVALYRELGLEVRLEPLMKVCGSGIYPCTSCIEADADPERYKVIYTRRSEGEGSEEEELS